MFLAWGVIIPVVIGTWYYKHIKSNSAKKTNDSRVKYEEAVYAIGDLHGDYECAKHWVNRTGLIIGLDNEDEMSWKWRDNSSSLVFMGDYIDKGPTSRQTVELVKKLTERFPEYVTALLGNHELQLLKDRYDYKHHGSAYFHHPYAVVHPMEYLNYVEKEDSDMLVVEALYNASLEVYASNAHSKVRFSPYSSNSIVKLIPQAELRSQVQSRLALYQDSYIKAYASSSPLGQWLQTRPVIHLAHKTLFLHGGLTPRLAAFLSSTKDPTRNVQSMNTLFQANADEATLNHFLETTYHGQLIEEFIWYRGNFKIGGCSDLQSHFESIPLQQLTRVAVGHTPDYNIRLLCDDSLLAVDSSLSRWFRVMGNDYCRGDIHQRSRNGQYSCSKIRPSCEGQIIKIMNDTVHVISA